MKSETTTRNNHDEIPDISIHSLNEEWDAKKMH